MHSGSLTLLSSNVLCSGAHGGPTAPSQAPAPGRCAGWFCFFLIVPSSGPGRGPGLPAPWSTGAGGISEGSSPGYSSPRHCMPGTLPRSGTWVPPRSRGGDRQSGQQAERHQPSGCCLLLPAAHQPPAELSLLFQTELITPYSGQLQ